MIRTEFELGNTSVFLRHTIIAWPQHPCNCLTTLGHMRSANLENKFWDAINPAYCYHPPTENLIQLLPYRSYTSVELRPSKAFGSLDWRTKVQWAKKYLWGLEAWSADHKPDSQRSQKQLGKTREFRTRQRSPERLHRARCWEGRGQSPSTVSRGTAVRGSGRGGGQPSAPTSRSWSWWARRGAGEAPGLPAAGRGSPSEGAPGATARPPGPRASPPPLPPRKARAPPSSPPAPPVARAPLSHRRGRGRWGERPPLPPQRPSAAATQPSPPKLARPALLSPSPPLPNAGSTPLAHRRDKPMSPAPPAPGPREPRRAAPCPPRCRPPRCQTPLGRRRAAPSDREPRAPRPLGSADGQPPQPIGRWDSGRLGETPQEWLTELTSRQWSPPPPCHGADRSAETLARWGGGVFNLSGVSTWPMRSWEISAPFSSPHRKFRGERWGGGATSEWVDGWFDQSEC